MFRCMEYSFYIQNFWAICMRLPWKTELPRYFSLYLNMYFLSIRIFEQLTLALKNRVAQKFFAVLNILFTFWIWATCACPDKQRVPWIYCTEYIFFIIQKFWVTCACPEKQSCPDIFLCIEYTLYIQEFWATCTCPEKQSCPEIFRCMEYTFTLRIFEQVACACPEKQSCPDIFTVLNMYLLLFRSFE